MTLREFLDRHSSLELAEIEARDRLDPIDPVGRLEFGLAKIAALIFNANRDSNASEPATSADFMPQWGESYREEAEIPQTPEERVAKVRAAFARMRAKP